MSIVINGTKIKIPQSSLVFRRRNEGVFSDMQSRGESMITSIIASNRVTDSSQKTYQDLFQPSLSGMQFWKMKDIDLAAQRITEAKRANEIVGLVTDFDVDGISSAVVMYLALTEYMGFDKDNVQIHVNNRMKYGYGFNNDALDAVIERSGERLPTLLITADQGSNDSSTIRVYKDFMSENGIDNADVIVTDHHHIKEGETCSEAFAFVNPQRPDCQFDDPTICGCVVALLVMSAAREYMKQNGDIPEDTPSLTPLLTYASLATVADCVSLKSGYNRCIIRKGLSDINNEVIPAWTVLKNSLNRPNGRVNVGDLGFKLGPAINSDSRTGGDGSDAIAFLLSTTVEEATVNYKKLQKRNTRRKEVDAAMQEAALKEASTQYYEEKKKALCIYLPKGSHGIHGIVASRVKENFSCPVIMFSPVDVNEKENPEKVITGSGRCIEQLSIVYMIQDKVGHIVEILGSGGHPAAMGLRIKLKNLAKFQKAFDDVVKEQALEIGLDNDVFSPHVMIDHLFQENDLHLLNSTDILSQVNRLEPYGQKFEAPVFAINGTLKDTKKFGKGVNENAHLTLIFRDSKGFERHATVFFYAKQPWMNELAVGESFTLAVTLNYDDFRKGVGMIVQSASSGINSITK
jgi:single-stranded-DNA-specific exonuclease